MTARPPYDPTAPLKPVTRGRGDTPPPAPPHEIQRQVSLERAFMYQGRSWIARLSGKAACGTGSYGLALVRAVHFSDAAAPERPLREALIAHGDYDALFDDELIRLLAMSRPIENRDPGGAGSSAV